MRALARDPGRLKRFDEIEIIEGSLSNRTELARLAEGASVFIHCAGLTHARTNAEFIAVNIEGSRAAAKASALAGAKFIHISSLAARAPNLSAYAASKHESEIAVAECGENWIGLRAPAMYGPGDSATLPYFRMVKNGFAPEPAARPSPRASILYVNDFAEAVLAAFDAAPGQVYEVGDECSDGHSWGEIGSACAAALGVKATSLRLPRWAMTAFAAPAAAVERMFGGAPMVTPGKVREFFHHDWAARETLLTSASDWRPSTPLHEGFAKTVRWYQEKDLL